MVRRDAPHLLRLTYHSGPATDNPPYALTI